MQNNGMGSVTVAASGNFTFEGSASSGTAYAVTVSAQPTVPSQTCTVANGAGIVGSGNVSDIAVKCVTNTYSVGGTVGGLVGSGLTLRNNGGGDLVLGQMAGEIAEHFPLSIGEGLEDLRRTGRWPESGAGDVREQFGEVEVG